MIKLIGLYSDAPASGKSAVAAYLHRHNGFVVVPFAQTLKEAVIPVLVGLGYSSADAVRLVYRDKHYKVEEVGVSVRHMLQTLGTEWGRQCIHPSLWLKCWEKQVSRYDYVVVDDVRFENEAELVKKLGGVLWKVERPTAYESTHESEGSLKMYKGFDAVLQNDKSLEELELRVEELLR